MTAFINVNDPDLLNFLGDMGYTRLASLPDRDCIYINTYSKATLLLSFAELETNKLFIGATYFGKNICKFVQFVIENTK